MVGSLFDDLNDLPEGAIERLVEVALGRGAKTSLPVSVKEQKIKIAMKNKPKAPGKGLKHFEPDLYTGKRGTWVNAPVIVTVELPGYLVAGLDALFEEGSRDEHIRLAVREYFEKRDIKWWYPRFLMSAMHDIQSAKDRFTHSMR